MAPKTEVADFAQEHDIVRGRYNVMLLLMLLDWATRRLKGIFRHLGTDT